MTLMGAFMVLLGIIVICSIFGAVTILLAFYAFLILIFVVAPLVELFFLVRRIRRRSFGEVGVGLLLLFLFNSFISWCAYTAIYPPDSFYEDEFLGVSGLTFPPSGDVVFADATYPDLHGDYCSACLIDVDSTDYSLLQEKCKTDTSGGFCGSPSWYALVKHLGYDPEFSALQRKEEGDTYTLWGLLKNRRSVIVYRSSS
jgi:hypothetical protein